MTLTIDAKLQESINRAENGLSWTNYPAIIEGFIGKGIEPDAIIPRVNVFTYKVWKAKGRQVQKGQRGVKVVTWIENEKTKKKFPKNATVFHISQTEPIVNED